MLFKTLHITTVIVSAALFVTRGVWSWRDSPLLQRRWLRILPHANDSVLLVSALALAWQYGQYPFVDHWLTAKVLALLAYIGLGMVALRPGRSKRVRASAWTVALLVFAYIVGVAISKSPTWFQW